ncbi:MAG: 30S ribosomal protein S5 [bacterium]|nr:30S ribosomal protein S5 [bacterium]
MARPRDSRSSNTRHREKSEFDQAVLDVRRTARVVQGGRRFTFRVTVVIGDRNGRVGVGMGKGVDVTTGMDKAVFQAKKNILKIPLTAQKSISSIITGKMSAARVLLRPAPDGHGLVAGGPVRVIAELAGIKNLTAKILGRTPNKLNNAKATLEALKKLKA